MLDFNLANCLTISVVVFLIGCYGALTRRSLVMILLSIEVILNGVNFTLISFNHFHWGAQEFGHYLYMLSIGVAAAEAAIGLAMAIVFYRNYHNISRERAARLSEVES